MLRWYEIIKSQYWSIRSLCSKVNQRTLLALNHSSLPANDNNIMTYWNFVSCFLFRVPSYIFPFFGWVLFICVEVLHPSGPPNANESTSWFWLFDRRLSEKLYSVQTLTFRLRSLLGYEKCSKTTYRPVLSHLSYSAACDELLPSGLALMTWSKSPGAKIILPSSNLTW